MWVETLTSVLSKKKKKKDYLFVSIPNYTMPGFHKKMLWNILAVLAVFLIINFLAAVVVGYIEDINYTNSFYLTMSASTLSGYGNVAAETNGGKWFISFFQLFGFTVFFYALSVIVEQR